MLAIEILKWPGMNEAFLFSFITTTAMGLAVIPFGKRRPLDRKTTWGEAMVATVYVFFAMFLAFGIVPHQFLAHSDNNLGWRKDKIIYGPLNLLKPKVLGGHFPFTMSYEALRDIIVVVIHVYFIALMMYLFVWWQKRGEKTAKAVEMSSYGRPLVRKA